jgi:hypothetical protein
MAFSALNTGSQFACFCEPSDLFLIGWGMDASTGAGREHPTVWNAAD